MLQVLFSWLCPCLAPLGMMASCKLDAEWIFKPSYTLDFTHKALVTTKAHQTFNSSLQINVAVITFIYSINNFIYKI